MTRPVAIAAIGSAAVFIRWPHMTESLWFDEVWRTNIVLGGGDLGRLFWHDVHNPLYNALMYAWTAVFGDSELSVRMPSLIFGLAAIGILARWMRPRFGATPAVLAAVLLLLSPVHAWYSCEAKNNMMVMLLAVALVIRADTLARRWAWTDAAMVSVVGALAVYTSWQSLLAVVPVFAYVIAAAGVGVGAGVADPAGQTPPRVRLITAATAILGTLALCAPLLIFKASRLEELERAYVATATLGRMLRFLFVWLPTGNALVRIHDGWWALWAGIYGLVVLPALWLGIRGLWSVRPGRLVVLCLAIPVVSLPAITHLSSLLGLEAPRVYQERNLLVVLPWFSAAVAVGACRARVAAVGLIALLVGLSLASSIAAVTWRSHVTTVMNPNPDWRAACRYMRARAEGSGLPAVVLSHCPLLPIRYHGEEMRSIELPWSPDVAVQLASHRDDFPGSEVFFINNPMWWGMGPGELAAFESGLDYLERRDFLSLNVYRLGPAATPGD
ncbi:MAG: glycosyltransferase family 39 protein [Phycisphaerae bacterium]|nr:glycosyltransferase family 39 protein [Phycisphaerae bacterium]